MSRILYVDDANSMRKLVELVLAHTHDLELAENGLEAFQKAQTKQFDLIISDVNMPIMSGLEFLEKVRTLENYKFIPILMMTTEASREMKDQGKQLGATGWLVKPFNPERLEQIINKLL